MPDYDRAKLRRDAEAAKECGLRMLGMDPDVAISLFERLERAEEEVSDYQRACMGKTPETLIEKHAKEREELKSRLDRAEAAIEYALDRQEWPDARKYLTTQTQRQLHEAVGREFIVR